jgi:PAS domain S-box-containing protein
VTSPGVAAGQTGGAAQVTAEQFRLLVEGVKDYAIFLLDPEGRVASWNAGAERIKGYRAAEILGQHYGRFFEPHDAAAGKPARALARAAREGRYAGRGWRVRKDGSRFYAHVTINALFDETGQLKGFAKITRDVTAEQEAERTLREREHQLVEAQAVAQMGSFEWDLTTDQVACSAELYRIYGLDPDTFAGTFAAFLRPVHPDDRAVVANAIRRAGREGTPFRMQVRIVRPDGDLRRRGPRRAGPAVAGARGLPGRDRLAATRGAARRGARPGRALPPPAERAAAEPVAAGPGVAAANPLPGRAGAGPARRRLLRRAGAV